MYFVLLSWQIAIILLNIINRCVCVCVCVYNWDWVFTVT